MPLVNGIRHSLRNKYISNPLFVLFIKPPFISSGSMIFPYHHSTRISSPQIIDTPVYERKLYSSAPILIHSTILKVEIKRNYLRHSQLPEKAFPIHRRKRVTSFQMILGQSIIKLVKTEIKVTHFVFIRHFFHVQPKGVE